MTRPIVTKGLRRLGGFVTIVAASWLDGASDALERAADRMAALSERLMPTSELLGLDAISVDTVWRKP